MGLFYPALITPAAKPVVKWFGGSDEIAEEAFKYLRITAVMSMFFFFFNTHCSMLQGEGRTWLYAGMMLLALLLDMCLLLSLFLFKYHWGTWAAGLATSLS
jgi:Na+-driven multidrug efflux pump